MRRRRAIRCPRRPDGSQAPGRDCNKIPQGLINPIAQKLINLYPLPNANNPALGYNYVNEPVRKLNEGEFDIRLDHNLLRQGLAVRALQLRSGDFLRSGRFAGIRRSQSVRQQSGHSQSRAQRGCVGNPRVFASTPSINSTPATTGSSTTSRRKARAVARRRNSAFRARIWRSQLRTDFDSDGRRLLVVGRSRILAVPGRHQCFLDLRFVRYDSRQP